jgi:hypothetical protein
VGRLEARYTDTLDASTGKPFSMRSVIKKNDARSNCRHLPLSVEGVRLPVCPPSYGDMRLTAVRWYIYAPRAAPSEAEIDLDIQFRKARAVLRCRVKRGEKSVKEAVRQ